MTQSTYGGTGTAKSSSGVVEPTTTLVDINNEPGHWTVTLAPLRKADGGQPVASIGDFFARIELGAGGRATTIDVDWPIHGGTVTLSTETIRVNGLFSEFVSAPGAVFVPDIVFTAWATPASGPRTGLPPPRTRIYGNIPATGSPAALVRLPIPTLARYYGVQIGDASGAVFAGQMFARWYDMDAIAVPVRTEVWQLSTLGGGVGVYCGIQQGGGQFNPDQRLIAIPPNARDLELENFTGVQLNRVRAVFYLDAG